MNPFGDMPVGDDRNPFGDRPVSTITGKPIPSSMENIQRTGQVWKTAGPIIGDVGMTALAPEVKALGWMGNLALRSAMSGAGSFGGSVAGQKMAGGPVDIKEAEKQGLLGLVGEPILTGAGAMLKMAGKPLKFLAESKLNPFERQLKSWVKKNQAKIAEKEILSAEKIIKDIAPDVVKKQKVPKELENIDTMIAATKDDVSMAYEKYKKPLYNYAKEHGGVIKMPETTTFLSDLAKNQTPRSAFIADFGLNKVQRNELANIMQTGQAKPEVIEKLLSDRKHRIFAKYKNLTENQKIMREELKDAFLNDLEKSGASGFRADADTMFKTIARFKTVRKLFKMGKTAEGKTWFYPYQTAKNIYEAKSWILNKKTGLPDLWPKLKEMADHYLTIYKPLQKISADDKFSIKLAYNVLPEYQKKILKGFYKGGAFGVKSTGKAAIHMAGEEMPF